MRRHWFQGVVLLALLLACVLAWRLLFPNPEQIIRRNLGELARLASHSANEAPAARLLNAGKLAGYFTSDAVVRVNVPGEVQVLTGRDEIARVAVMVRERANSVHIELSDPIITVAPDKCSAVVNLTGRANAPGETEFFVQELRLDMTRSGRDWLISKAETVKTLR